MTTTKEKLEWYSFQTKITSTQANKLCEYIHKKFSCCLWKKKEFDKKFGDKVKQ